MHVLLRCAISGVLIGARMAHAAPSFPNGAGLQAVPFFSGASLPTACAVVSLAPGDPPQLFVLEKATGRVLWLHGGFLQGGRSGQSDLWVVSAGGGTPVRITDDRAAEIDPAWSAAGNELVFVSSRDGSPNVWLATGLPRFTTGIMIHLKPAARPARMQRSHPS